MTQQALVSKLAAQIEKRAPGFTPEIGLILGSGLGDVARELQNTVTFSYEELEGFPVSSVAGHKGQLILGELGPVKVACLQGRVHLYEGVAASEVKVMIRTLKAIGCKMLLITNAAGSLKPDVGPGNLSLITDHINFQAMNPLIGANDETFGPRFFAMDNTYDKELRLLMKSTAKRLQIALHEGVYISVTGPSFETPAEIRAFKLWGADLIGMSTVPEVLVARHCGLKVLAVSAITNLACGLSDETLTHENTLHYGKMVAANLTTLIKGFMEDYKPKQTKGVSP